MLLANIAKDAQQVSTGGLAAQRQVVMQVLPAMVKEHAKGIGKVK